MTNTTTAGFATLARTTETEKDGFDPFAPAVRDAGERKAAKFDPWAKAVRTERTPAKDDGFNPFAPCGR